MPRPECYRRQHGVGYRHRQNAHDNAISNNAIGTNATRTGAVANAQHGVGVFGASANAITSNLIANNLQAGVGLFGGVANRISGNQIHGNGQLGIQFDGPIVSPNDPGDTDTGTNNRQNFPVLAGVTGGVQGTLNSIASATFTIGTSPTPPAIRRGMARDRPSWARLRW